MGVSKNNFVFSPTMLDLKSNNTKLVDDTVARFLYEWEQAGKPGCYLPLFTINDDYNLGYVHCHERFLTVEFYKYLKADKIIVSIVDSFLKQYGKSNIKFFVYETFSGELVDGTKDYNDLELNYCVDCGYYESTVEVSFYLIPDEPLVDWEEFELNPRYSFMSRNKNGLFFVDYSDGHLGGKEQLAVGFDNKSIQKVDSFLSNDECEDEDLKRDFRQTYMICKQIFDSCFINNKQ